MTKVLQLVNGIPRMVTTASLIYDQLFTISGTITSGTSITLPSSGSFVGADLQVYVNGVIQELTNDYTYVGSSPYTQVTFTYNLLTTDTLRFRIE